MSIWDTIASGPLAGVRVVDMSTTLMGPYCSLLLTQMGADVIKVEAPDGDIVRQIGDRHDRGLGHTFMNINRGKRSVKLDLRERGDHALMMRLLVDADVFVSNLRPASAERLGVGYRSVAEVNPGLVHCSMFGYGRGGPYADNPAYDDVIQGASGTAMIQGADAPEYIRSAHADKTVGLMALSGILSALFERSHSGQGQAIEVPMFECMIAVNAVEQLGGLTFMPQDGPPGYSRTSSPYRKPYATKDGYIAVVVYTDRQWRSFFSLIGRPELADQESYSTMRERTIHIDELYQLLEARLLERTTQDWLDEFARSDIPAMPVLSLADLVDDPHVLASGLFETVEHPSEGTLRQPGLPWTYSRTRTESVAPAPALGEHTEDVRASFERHRGREPDPFP